MSRGLVSLCAATIALCVSAFPSLATNFFVDNSVATSGSGTSWSNAWKNFSNINWSAVKPGDTIYISGGSSGKTYNETLTVRKSGAAGSPITITKGIAAGHNGTVTINGNGSRSYGVVVDGYNHVIISRLQTVNHAGAGFRVRNVTAGVVIEKNVVYASDPPGSGNARGYDIRNSRNSSSNPVIVRFNSYSTPTSSNDQNDGIWSSDNEGVLYQGNSIIISNNYTGTGQGHNDCLQSLNDYGITVVSNYCEQRNSKTGHSQGYYVENGRGKGVFTIYNNIAYSPNTNSNQLILDNNISGFAGVLRAYNNTIYGGRYGSLRIRNSPSSIVKNNIFVSARSGGWAFKIDGGISKANFDYNLIYTPNSNYVGYIRGVDTFTPSEWRVSGYNVHGIIGNPMFVDIGSRNFKLKSGSPAIDKGLTIPIVANDFDGTSRPQGAAYDIGAYEK